MQLFFLLWCGIGMTLAYALANHRVDRQHRIWFTAHIRLTLGLAFSGAVATIVLAVSSLLSGVDFKQLAVLSLAAAGCVLTLRFAVKSLNTFKEADLEVETCGASVGIYSACLLIAGLCLSFSIS